jgi:hypothetical protein
LPADTGSHKATTERSNLSLSVAIPVIAAADVAIVALLAFAVSRAALLTPHHGAGTVGEQVRARPAARRLARRAARHDASLERHTTNRLRPARS